jgi:hypothetical protein
MELKDKMRPIADEYAKAVGKVIGYEPEYWVGSDINLDCCCYGDCYFLGLDEMQVIIDHMPGWIEKYGSQEKVGETVVKWLDWVIDDNVDEMGNYRNHPQINLWSWLMGLRPEQLNRQSDIYEIVSLEHQVNVMRYVLKTYPTSTIENAAKQIEARINVLKERHSKETAEFMKDHPAYHDFVKTLNEADNEKAGIS